MNETTEPGSRQLSDKDLETKMRLVSIKFREAGKRYDFNAQTLDLAVGSQVVVETDRGRALGSVVIPPFEADESALPKDLKTVIRLATDEDLALAVTNQRRETEALKFCHQRIIERRLDMKLVRAEYLFDGSKIIFYFTADGRIDFRELVKDLAHYFHTRIEMRQIGVRDEAKLVGGIGVCGRELCCCTFLTEFSPVSVKMAKEQGLALNPSKISGQCGRLLCCLSYEFETYCKLRKGLPKTGKKIQFGGRNAEIIDTNVLGQKLTLRFEDGERTTISAEEFTAGAAARPPAPANEAVAEQKPQQQRRKPRPPRAQSNKPRQDHPPATEPSGDKAPAGDATSETKPKRRRRRGKRKPKQD